MKLTRLRVLFIAIVAVLFALWALEMFAGFDLVQTIFANLAFVVVGIIFLSFMSVIGGFFLGMWISARLFSTRGFTPFEEEMLRMREEVKEMREQLKRIEGDRAKGDRREESEDMLGTSSVSVPDVPAKVGAAISGPVFQTNGSGAAPVPQSPGAFVDAGTQELVGKQI